jgi:biotin synthase
MNINTKSDVLEVLNMPYQKYCDTAKQEAKQVHKLCNNDSAVVTALLGYDNICKNRCTYCGMRAGQLGVNRYRMEIEDIYKAEESVKEQNIDKIFLISGEDPKYDFNKIISCIGSSRS